MRIKIDNRRFKRLASLCFDIFRYPIVKLHIENKTQWRIANIVPMGLHQLPDELSPWFQSALRAYTRTRVYTKPREISGLAAFASVPYVVIDEGTYRAKVEVKLDIREVLPYKVY